MKEGSLVVVKKFRTRPEYNNNIVWLPIGDEQTIYTIRKIFKDEENTTLASLEEGVIGYIDDDKELGIPLRLLIEVQPPVDLTQIFSNDKMSL